MTLFNLLTSCKVNKLYPWMPRAWLCLKASSSTCHKVGWNSEQTRAAECWSLWPLLEMPSLALKIWCPAFWEMINQSKQQTNWTPIRFKDLRYKREPVQSQSPNKGTEREWFYWPLTMCYAMWEYIAYTCWCKYFSYQKNSRAEVHMLFSVYT